MCQQRDTSVECHEPEAMQ